ncbi:MAG: O-antigen ligase family protein [Deltaproteobacteria bacterium]|nr:O-antigen ligase family protein [Deltaproteobacteria bacterium]
MTKERFKSLYPAAGAAILLSACFGGVFSRALANILFPLLLIWALAALFLFSGERRPPAPPRVCLWGIALYLGLTLPSAVFSLEPERSFIALAVALYLLLTAFSVWMVVSLSGDRLLKLVPFFYGAGLIAWFLISFRESSYCVACLRAMADLGVMDSGAVLSQVVPLLLGALALNIQSERRKLFFIAALIFGCLSLYMNCSRIALITTPASSALMIIAFRRRYGKAVWIALAVSALILGSLVLSDQGIRNRFGEMFKGAEASNPNLVRYSHWKKGWEQFLQHPVLGNGPDAVRNLEFDDLPVSDRGYREDHLEFYHAHQTFITVLAESGILGLLGFMALILLPLIYIWPHRKTEDILTRFYVWGAFTVFIQFFLNALTDHVFSIKPPMYVYWTVFSAAVFMVKRKRDESPSGEREQSFGDKSSGLKT